MKRYELNKLIRAQLKISGRELGELVGVTKQTISHYETGRKVKNTVERVIEFELDKLIANCTDDLSREFCRWLASRRTEEA